MAKPYFGWKTYSVIGSDLNEIIEIADSLNTELIRVKKENETLKIELNKKPKSVSKIVYRGRK